MQCIFKYCGLINNTAVKSSNFTDIHRSKTKQIEKKKLSCDINHINYCYYCQWILTVNLESFKISCKSSISQLGNFSDSLVLFTKSRDASDSLWSELFLPVSRFFSAWTCLNESEVVFLLHLSHCIKPHQEFIWPIGDSQYTAAMLPLFHEPRPGEQRSAAEGTPFALWRCGAVAVRFSALHFSARASGTPENHRASPAKLQPYISSRVRLDQLCSKPVAAWELATPRFQNYIAW